MIPSDTSGASQAWSTSLVTGTTQGTYEFVQGLAAAALKSPYVIYFPPLLSPWGFILFYFKYKLAFPPTNLRTVAGTVLKFVGANFCGRTVDEPIMHHDYSR